MTSNTSQDVLRESMLQRFTRTLNSDPRVFAAALLIVVGLAIVRSALATRLDSFTVDEAYHIAAGVSYVQRADFRINPEHPPLVKLWVGSFLTVTGFRLSPLRVFQDKVDERNFTQEEVYLHNDPDSVQRRARAAMFALNGLLLAALALALRRCFGGLVALGSTLYLAIDPTVAAHLPVVMTDLPVALLASTAVACAACAFRDWKWNDLVGCTIFMGLALGAKHSAPVFCIFIGAMGIGLAFLGRDARGTGLSMRIAKVCAMLAGALVILWGMYFFRFHESEGASETFNRSLTDKISDVGSGPYRFVLNVLSATHLTPRAYLWGFADTVHAGLEGRAFTQFAFGHVYYAKAPWFFFPGVIAAKLPIGLILLSIVGAGLFLARRLPREWTMPTAALLGAGVWFLFVLKSGATYAGVRHALPLLPILAVMGGLASYTAMTARKASLKIVVALGFLAAGCSALPVLRPWEYFNEFAGGPSNGYLHFNDEGVDLGQRTKEIARYYHEAIQPTGEVPLLNYQFPRQERKARGIDWLGLDMQRDQARLNSHSFQGVVIIDGKFMDKRLWWNTDSLRAAQPVARVGNVFVYRGTFDMSGSAARNLYFTAIGKEYARQPDLKAAEELLNESVQADPSAYFVYIELGNLALKRGAREEALREYTNALNRAPDDLSVRQPIEQQLRRVSTEDLSRVSALRNPQLE